MNTNTAIHSDTELLEGLARAIYFAGRPIDTSVHPDSPHERMREIAEKVWNSPLPEQREYIDIARVEAQAAIQYLQQHVAPVVEALKYYENNDDDGKKASVTLVSLPPILRGESVTGSEVGETK